MRAAIRKCLKLGCQKHANVYFYGPGNTAKSHTIEPLYTIFGRDAFVRPTGKANQYPLQNLFHKKVVLLTFTLKWQHEI